MGLIARQLLASTVLPATALCTFFDKFAAV
jgi:hypothetical protein